MFGKKKEKEKPAETADPLHDQKVTAGLADIEREDQARLKDGAITHEGAEQVAAKVKSLHPVFKSITVRDGGERWNYVYEASPPAEKTGEKKAEQDLPLKPGQQVLVFVAARWELATVNEVAAVGDRSVLWFKIASGEESKLRRALDLNDVLKDLAKGAKEIIRPFDPLSRGSSKYSHYNHLVDDESSVGPYRDFTANQKANIIQANIAHYGTLTSDTDNSLKLIVASRRARGKEVNVLEVNIDHVFPRSYGGWNSYRNAAVLSFAQNLLKSDIILD